MQQIADNSHARRAWQKFTNKMRELRGRQLVALKSFEEKANAEKLEKMRQNLKKL